MIERSTESSPSVPLRPGRMTRQTWLLASTILLCALSSHAQIGPGLQASALPAPRAEAPADEIQQTARLIGVELQMEDLDKYVRKGDRTDRWKILYLHQFIGERVDSTSLQVDATIAQIDNEIARAQEEGSFLSDRRDRTVNRANFLGILIGGGLGATSSGLQFTSKLNKPASSVGVGAGIASAAFGLAGIHAQRGASARFEYESNMLAEFFDRPTLADSRYPATINAFLEGLPLNHSKGLSRREELVQTWLSVKRIESLNDKNKIDRLTSKPSDGLTLTIDDLGDRAAMLQDVRARISYLKRDLGLLLASLPSISNYAQDMP